MGFWGHFLFFKTLKKNPPKKHKTISKNTKTLKKHKTLTKKQLLFLLKKRKYFITIPLKH